MSTLVITIISLCAIGVVSAVILYFVAQKFKVEEDPRIDIVEGLLPGANCGGCGYPGCRGLAEAAVLINRVQLVHIHKNDFHLLSLIISLPYSRSF